MPIKYFMSKENLITFKTDDFAEAAKEVMAKKRHRDFPILNKRGGYVGMISRRNMMNMTRKRLILVDHNEVSQAVDQIEEAEILEIIDHHRLGSLETISPVFFRNEPLGCTATIVYKMYKEANVQIESHIAGLLCAAIISDTLMYRSPTCTEVDKAAAQDLAKIAGIDVEQFAREMFNAGSNLKNKSPEEIFYQDFKKFNANGITFGVGQINSMNSDELEDIKSKLVPYMDKAYTEHGVDMLFFMLTNIIEESTELICQGKDANGLVESSFDVKSDNNSYTLKNVVSRKKQLIPAFMGTLQQ
jgi:manganese-dependent inorganic pyrophosphatase